jgi:GTPase SAR1 family protein
MATTLEEYKIDPKELLGKSIVFYGESESGKTTLIKDILYHLRDYADQLFAFCGSDESNHSYSPDLVPEPYVHNIITEDMLNEIWDRQEAFTVVYARASNVNILEKLFMMTHNKSAEQIVNSIKLKWAECKKEIAAQYTKEEALIKIGELGDTYKDTLVSIYKRIITSNIANLGAMKLDDEERFVLNHVTFNPNLIIIFDDVTEQIKKFNNQLQKFSYRARHIHTTIIFAMHTDKAFETSIKQGFYYRFFTTKNCALGYMMRSELKDDREAKKIAKTIINDVFNDSPENKYVKLVYSRNGTWMKYKAKKHPPFTFGSKLFRQYGEYIAAQGTAAKTGNKYMRDFI